MEIRTVGCLSPASLPLPRVPLSASCGRLHCVRDVPAFRPTALAPRISLFRFRSCSPHTRNVAGCEGRMACDYRLQSGNPPSDGKNTRAHKSGTPPMLSCAGAGSWYGVVVSARTRIGSTSESLAQETSAITTTESAETRIIDFFMAGNCR